jgi:hypothetical protein
MLSRDTCAIIYFIFYITFRRIRKTIINLIIVIVAGGMCWGSIGKNGLCKDLLAERVSKDQCCELGGTSVSTSWSPTDLDSGALFFWSVLGDGIPCTRCKGIVFH